MRIKHTLIAIAAVCLLGLAGRMSYKDEVVAAQHNAEAWKEMVQQWQKEKRKQQAIEAMNG